MVAMFGATFVFPAIMGLNPNLAVLMSGVATIIFLLIVNGKVPSYLGTSASFVAAVAAIRAQGGDSADVTGSILIAGVILALVGVLVHFGGAKYVRAVLPPSVTGAVVMLIGFNLATVATTIYFPNDQWVGLLTTAFLIGMAVLGRGFLSRIAVFLSLVFGYLISWIADSFSTVQSCNSAGKCVARAQGQLERRAQRVLDRPAQDHHQPDVRHADRPAPAGLQVHVHPARDPVGDRAAGGELGPRQGRVRDDRRRPRSRTLGRAFIGDGVGTALASLVGGSPTTTYAENIGVMAATRIYSTLAYYIAAVVAILFGFCPKFGAVVAATPGGVLGGITLVLYGMIGLLGAKIWIENRVNFADPVNLVPLAAGIIAGIGNLTIKFTSTFSITGIAAGTLIVIIGFHGVRIFRREGMKDEPVAAGRAYEGGAAISTGNIETPEGEVSPFRDGRRRTPAPAKSRA